VRATREELAEPRDRQVSWLAPFAKGPSRQRGTQYGSPEAFTRRGEFLGARRYLGLVIEEDLERPTLIEDLLVLEPLHGLVTTGEHCILYLLQDLAPNRPAMLIAVECDGQSAEATEVVGGFAGALESGLRRQAKLIAIPVLISVAVTIAVLGASVALMPPEVRELIQMMLILGAVVGLPLLALFLWVSLSVARSRLRALPTTEILRGLLRAEGFPLAVPAASLAPTAPR
jgi:hypothetical protein